jgi:hypothetical protein
MFRRRLYGAAAVAHSAAHVTLKLTTGAWLSVSDRDGNRVGSSRDARRRLVANIGDRLVVSPADVAVDAVAMLEVGAIEPNGFTLHCALVTGSLPLGAYAVHVMPGKRARVTKRGGR